MLLCVVSTYLFKVLYSLALSTISNRIYFDTIWNYYDITCKFSVIRKLTVYLSVT